MAGTISSQGELRCLPGVDRLLQGEEASRWIEALGRDLVVAVVRDALEEERRHILAGEAYARITDGETFELRYAPDTPADAPLTQTLALARDSDLRRRMTTRGPHRDDIHMHVAGEPARSFSSQGQQKTAALAVKLAEVSLVHARTGDWPVLMLDEVLAELDANRSRLLFGAVDDEVQCLVTTTDLRGLSHLVGPNATLFRIDRGALEKE